MDNYPVLVLKAKLRNLEYGMELCGGPGASLAKIISAQIASIKIAIDVLENRTE